MYCSWAWRKWSLDIHLLSWTPLPSMVNSHGILPRRSVKRPKLALMNSRVAILFLPCFLLVGYRTPWSHGHCSQGCPNPRISNQTFLVHSARSSSTSFLIGCICIRSYCQCFPGISRIVFLPVLSLQQVSGWFPMRTWAACPSWEYPHLSWMGGVYNSPFVFPRLKLSLPG